MMGDPGCGSRASVAMLCMASAFALASCGSAVSAPASHGPFRVRVPTARFPAAQRLASPSRMVIAVRNAGRRTIPDVTVTVCNVTCAADAPDGEGTSAAPFAADVSMSDLANHSRPLWIVDRQPGSCRFSCVQSGPGAGFTAYANTWALGTLAPGATATFDWSLTPVTPGRHVVAWWVAADTAGDTTALLPDGAPARGRFVVDVSAAPARSHLTASGTVAAGG